MIKTICGDNKFLVDEIIQTATNQFLKDNDELGMERVDGEAASFERIKESMLAQPFFSPRKLVIIRRPEANKQLVEELEHIIGSVPESTDVLLVVTKLDKRAKYAKFLQKNTEFIDCSQLDTRGLVDWLMKRAETNDASLNRADATTLVERVGTNQVILSSELDKLMLYNPKITKQMILNQTQATPQTTIFALLDAAFAGNKRKALAIYKEQRELKVEPLAMLGMIAWQLHVLLIVATAKDRGSSEIAKDAKVHPFVIQKSQKIMQRLNYAQLKELVAKALELDIKLKSQSISADDALQHFLLSV